MECSTLDILHDEYEELVTSRGKGDNTAVGATAETILFVVDGVLKHTERSSQRFNRFVGMKAVALLEKIMATPLNEAFSNNLSHHLDDVTTCLSSKEVAYEGARLINAVCARELLDSQSRQLLLAEVDEMYLVLCTDPASCSGIWAADQLFSKEEEPCLDPDTVDRLERVMTCNYQLISKVFEQQGDQKKFILCQHEVLSRQLLEDVDKLQWVKGVIILAGHLLSNNQFVDARYHLTCACAMLYHVDREIDEIEDPDEIEVQKEAMENRVMDLSKAWIQYCLQLYAFSRKHVSSDILSESSQQIAQLCQVPFQMEPFESEEDSERDDDDDRNLSEVDLFKKGSSMESIDLVSNNYSSDDSDEQLGQGGCSKQMDEKDKIETAVDLLNKLVVQSNGSTKSKCIEETNAENKEYDTDKNVVKLENPLKPIIKEIDHEKSSKISSNSTEGNISPDSEAEDADDLKNISLRFPGFEVTNWEDKVTADMIENLNDSRNLFSFMIPWLEWRLKHFNAKEFPEEFVNTVLELVDLYRYVAYYEKESSQQYTVHRCRSNALELLYSILKEIQPSWYLQVSVEILRELSQVQVELVNLQVKQLAGDSVGNASPVTYHNISALKEIQNHLEEYILELNKTYLTPSLLLDENKSTIQSEEVYIPGPDSAKTSTC